MSALAASLSAAIAFLLFVYATRNLRLTKQLEKVRLTLTELDRDDLDAGKTALHEFLKRHSYNLSAARDEADRLWSDWYICLPNEVIDPLFVATFHPFTYLSTLYAHGFLDRRTVLDRYALLFARYYFVFYTYLETMQIQGDQTHTALVLGRDSLAEIRRRTGELFEENPELRTFTIPRCMTWKTQNPSTVAAMARLRERRRGHAAISILTAERAKLESHPLVQ